mgnify:CR=1 FL=1|tara:strand:- start:1094 stop:1738 length:645 start_codon:yes stop_codon:yes gene_type:complete
MKSKTFNRDKLINTIKKVVGETPIFSVSSNSISLIIKHNPLEQYICENSDNLFKLLEFFQTNFRNLEEISKDGAPFITIIFNSITKKYCIQQHKSFGLFKAQRSERGITVSNDIEDLILVTKFFNGKIIERVNDYKCCVCYEKVTTKYDEFEDTSSIKYHPEGVYIRCIRCFNNLCIECMMSIVNTDKKLNCPVCRRKLLDESDVLYSRTHVTH